MKYCIYTDDGDKGYIWYDENSTDVMVTHPDAEIRKRVSKYLSMPHDFIVPNGKEMGNRAIMTATPKESQGILEMGLCEMYHSIGVHINWGETYKQSDPNTPPSTPSDNVLKSVDGDTFYEIIN